MSSSLPKEVAKAFSFERTKRLAMMTSSGRSWPCVVGCVLLQDDDNLEDIYNDDELKVMEFLKQMSRRQGEISTQLPSSKTIGFEDLSPLSRSTESQERMMFSCCLDVRSWRPCSFCAVKVEWQRSGVYKEPCESLRLSDYMKRWRSLPMEKETVEPAG